MPLEKIRIGISACLLGRQVRYNGTDKLDRFLSGTLSGYIDWIAVCPEVQMGLSVPRPPMHLLETQQGVRLISENSMRDLTQQLLVWAESEVDRLIAQEICGFVFKSKSPSCALTDTKVSEPLPSRKRRLRSGLFTAVLLQRLPQLPAIDENGIHDPDARENFIERIFAFQRLRQERGHEPCAARLQAFHRRHKLQLMAHSPDQAHQLGSLAAQVYEPGSTEAVRTREAYQQLFMQTLAVTATRSRQVNALQHALGYFKNTADTRERQQLLASIESYEQGQLPLIVPQTLLWHLAARLDEPYLREQYYLRPHPTELLLRNHP